jgi:hypothetical protein
MVHTYGFVTGWIDDGLAGKWFEKSGLPEGYYLASQQARAFGAEARFEKLARRGHFLGHDAPWRKEARIQAGSRRFYRSRFESTMAQGF